MKRKYFFSSALPKCCADKLEDLFLSGKLVSKISLLGSQIDRNTLSEHISHKNNLTCIDKIFVDSGAFAVHTGKAKSDVDDYIEYVNSIDNNVDYIAQFDTIPGTLGENKDADSYRRSSQLSWENYLYMRERLISPEKLVPVFHFGEDFSNLIRILEYRDSNEMPIQLIGISPANDTNYRTKQKYLDAVYDCIRTSSNPNAKTHLFGCTGLQNISQYSYYSCDSISHRIRSGWGQLQTQRFGVISLSRRASSEFPFQERCSSDDLEELNAIAEYYEYTIDELAEDYKARLVVDICETQKIFTQLCNAVERRTQRRLFKIPR